MSAPLRVLLVDHTAVLGGAELALVRLCSALDPLRVRPSILLFDDGPLRQLLEDEGHHVSVLALQDDIRTASRNGSRVSWSSIPQLLRGARDVAAFTARLTQLLRARRPDVVHTTSLKADLLCVVPAFFARVPLVWHVHDRIAADYLPALVAGSFRLLARYVPRHVVVNSLATASTLAPRKGRWTLAYPGLLPSQVRPFEGARDSSTPVVGIVGRLSPTKGQREFIYAAQQVLKVHPQATFRIIGSALFGEHDYARSLTDLIDELGLDEAVTLVGFVADPTTELDVLTVCVHASPVPEPFGQVVVEAMARGVPVVAMRAGGVPEILEPRTHDGALGLLVNPGDVDALADAISDVVTDPAAAIERAHRAWLSVQRRFMIDRSAEAVMQAWASASHLQRP
ncbi:Glycosyltransferase involved in cell wall bisynthesis [Sanguibacter gelidistatuariae]|uniref:Glycosyltransferase involved in cell wall bisynthesis n=1 Tax=Sanguibacter gelidistatuariae TaxID=1814289 RepID=A0A1G6QCI3_9MICO|nr:glycosyltransferase [Sanguibacter gelidistatuariae]SDC89387.1 Glycosyltransferase involved in cell wall bisynthesis [Sanguibacter gelidistatuariae]